MLHGSEVLLKAFIIISGRSRRVQHARRPCLQNIHKAPEGWFVVCCLLLLVPGFWTGWRTFIDRETNQSQVSQVQVHTCNVAFECVTAGGVLDRRMQKGHRQSKNAVAKTPTLHQMLHSGSQEPSTLCPPFQTKGREALEKPEHGPGAELWGTPTWAVESLSFEYLSSIQKTSRNPLIWGLNKVSIF